MSRATWGRCLPFAIGVLALAASACDHGYFSAQKSWKQVSDMLPRCRFIPQGRAGIAGTPLSDLDLQQVLEAASPADCRIVRETEQILHLEVEAPSSGLLVIADTAYPGWTCQVDGAEVPIKSVHGIFRGVHIAAGQHRVEFAYRPQSFRAGCACSILGVAAALVIGRISLVPQLKLPG